MSVLPAEDQQQYLRVLLIEDEANTISVLSLFLSEIKECKFTVCPTGKDAVSQIPVDCPDLVLFAHGLDREKSLEVFSELHRLFPSLYLLVSLPESEQKLASEYVNAGAVECILKDKSYILKLVYAVKNAMTRVAERQSIDLPPMPRAQQLSMDENLPDVVFVLDPDGKFLHANRVVTDVLGYEPNTLVQRPLMEIMDPRNSSSFQNFLLSTQAGKHFQEQVSIRKKNGHSEVFDLNCTEIEDFLIYGVARPQKVLKESQRATTRMKEEAAPISDDSLPPLIGPYRVVTLLGAGSTGRVYKGYDESLDRHVAIKVISKVLHSDSGHLERFHREAKILASITHPNIALVYYFGNLQSLPYFCMEFLPGGSLENLLQKAGKLPAETAISYTMQVAVGLHEAYKKGVVHLDIKPSNLMIAENERIKIVDFGFARKTEKEHSQDGNHSSANAVEPKAIPADYRVDIFSLGVTLYRMLYGTTPHSTTPQTLELLDERNLNPQVPKILRELADRMIAREPAKQFRDYPHLIEDLEKARRLFVKETPSVQPVQQPDVSVLMRGLIFDTQFPEILGQIYNQRLTGKLTLSWIDICKNIYFRDGIIVGVLSNQEGESFIEVLMKMNQLGGKKAKKVESEGYDLLKSYSWALRGISSDVREKVLQEMKQLALRTLQGMFSLVVGEYLFDPSKFRGELTLQLPADELIVTGVKNWMDKTLIRRRLFEKQFRIKRHHDFKKLLTAAKIPSSDTFLIFRFEDTIHFQELYPPSGITEDECLKLIYLYKCFGLIEVSREQYTPVSKPKAAPAAAQPVVQVRPIVQPKPAAPQPLPAKEAQSEKGGLDDIEAEQIRESNQRAAKVQTEKEYFSYYQRCAEESFHNKNYWAAVEYCKKALEYKKDATVFSLMGNAFASHPKFRAEAMEAYKKALQMDPNNPVIFRDIADLYYDTGSLKLAKSRYEDALMLDPRDEHSKTRIAEISKKL